MAFTKVTAAGINTGGSFVLENINTSGIITASTVNVGSAVTISSSGANVTGIVTAGTVQVGSATTIHTTGIDLGGGTLTSHNINSTGIITATSGFDGNLTGNVTGDLTGNVTGNVSSSGANTLGSLTVTNDATVGGALTVTGDFTVNGTTTTIDTIVTAVDSLAVDGNVTAGGNLNITGVSTFQNDVNFAGATGVTSAFFDKSDNSLKFFDSTKAKFGNGNDLEIYHDGTHSHVREVGTGDLRLRSSKIQLMNPSSEPYFIGNSDGAVELYYDNSKKFETTGTGVTITGDARVTGILTVGTASVTIDGSQDFPTIRPTLDLNFAATKTLDRRITFTRDSIATYTDELGIIRTAPNNVPRFDHDPDTGESLGLLIEESRTNLLTNSNTFNSQTVTNVTISADTTDTLSPDGTYNAAKITDNSTNGDHRFLRTYTVVSGSIYTSSIFIKKGTQRYVSILAPTATSTKLWATYDLQDGVITGSHTSTTATITPYPNDWYRCTIKTSAGASASAYLEVSFNSTGVNPSWPTTTKPAEYSGSGDYFYVWGMQGELGSFPTSYIPTSGSTVTRGYDLIKITGTNFTDFYNQTEGTVFSSHQQYSGQSDTQNTYVYQIANATSSSVAFRLVDKNNYYSNPARLTATQWTNDVMLQKPDVTNGERIRTAFACKVNDAAVSYDGATVLTDTSLDMNSGQIEMSIGGFTQSPQAFLNGHIQQISYYPKRLPNAQLQSLTRQ